MSQLALFTMTPASPTPSPPLLTPVPTAPRTTLRRGSSFSHAGRRYQVEELVPDWGEHGKLVALDLSNTTVPIRRVWTNLAGFTRTTGYALEA